MAAIPIAMLPRLPGLPGRGGEDAAAGFLVRTGGFTVTAGDRVLADMTAGAWPLKLPANAGPGDSFELLIYGPGPLTIERNGHNIAGIADDGVIPGNTNAHLCFVYLNATDGWVYGGAP